MITTGAAGSSGKSLLDRFPADVRQRLDITSERCNSHDVLLRADELPRWAHFPHYGTVVSLTRTTEDGTTVEVGIVGAEGVVAVQTLLLLQPTGSDAVIQIPGGISRVPLDAIRRAMADSPDVRELVLRFAGTFMGQVSQHATCNRAHSIEQRLAKWLLAVRDRIDTDELELTHDFLAHMLGVRRAGATVAAGALALDGLIEQHRGSLRIVDREGLEERACECYRVVRGITASLRLTEAAS